MGKIKVERGFKGIEDCRYECYLKGEIKILDEVVVRFNWKLWNLEFGFLVFMEKGSYDGVYL